MAADLNPWLPFLVYSIKGDRNATHSTATTARGLHLPHAAASHTHAGHTCRKMEKWSPGTSMTSQSSHMSYQQAPCGTTAQHTRKVGR